MTVWIDRSVQYPTRYTATKVGGGALSSGDDITLTPSTGTVAEVGTPVNAFNMNSIETRFLVIAYGGLLY